MARHGHFWPMVLARLLRCELCADLRGFLAYHMPGEPGSHPAETTADTAWWVAADEVVRCFAMGGEAEIGASEPGGPVAGAWAIYTPKADAEIITDISEYGPQVSNDFMASLVSAEMMLELAELEKAHSVAAKNFLSLQVKPNRTLMAKVDIPKGKLVLVPCTSKIVSKQAQGSFEVLDHGWGMDSRKFVPANPCVLPKDEEKSQNKALLVPFFFLQSTDVIEHANMELQRVKAKSKSFSFPVHKNTGKIAAIDQLLYYKSKSKTIPALDMSPAKRKATPKKKAKKWAWHTQQRIDVSHSGPPFWCDGSCSGGARTCHVCMHSCCA